ncbi:MAG: hypothetical protein A2V96_00115 [Candidatus Yonathbacteria bacterium RBG_16_43_6]|nr:MAG: hypothetical protein A2V96_00115 [Candidatus Yonathbacteria bacterium RBG_16_43_6]
MGRVLARREASLHLAVAVLVHRVSVRKIGVEVDRVMALSPSTKQLVPNAIKYAKYLFGQ